MSQKTVYLLFGIICLFVIIGLIYLFNSNSPEPVKFSGLGGDLQGLISAENYSEFANEKGLEIKDGKVKVIIELSGIYTSKYKLPANYGNITGRSESLISALIYIDKLESMVEDPNVSYIRTPYPHDTTSPN